MSAVLMVVAAALVGQLLVGRLFVLVCAPVSPSDVQAALLAQ